MRLLSWGVAAEYKRLVGGRADLGEPSQPLTEADLEPLPAPVRRYVARSGALGRSRVRSFGATWRGRIRHAPDEPWMKLEAEQRNFVAEPARFFLMRGSRSGVPFVGLHAFADGAARMEVRLLSLFPIVEAGGPETTRAETVTLLNDFAVLAPGALVDPAIAWETIDDRSACARYTVGNNTVAGELRFDDEDRLVDFVSDDRLRASADGKSMSPQRWSTPLHHHRPVGPWTLATRGEGVWHPPEGSFAYLELELLELVVDGHHARV